MAKLTSERLAEDATFRAVAAATVDFLKREIAIVNDLSEAEIASRAHRARRVAQRARELQRKKSAEVPERLVGEMAELLGLEPKSFLELSEATRNDMGALLKANPELESVTAPEAVALVRGALEALGVEQDLRTAIAKSDASEEQRCTNLCNAIAAVLLLLVGVSYVLAAAACGFLILIVPLFILCLISAIADALAKTSVVLGWRDDCYDACLG